MIAGVSLRELGVTMKWSDKLGEGVERYAGKAARKKVLAGREMLGASPDPMAVAKWVSGAITKLDELNDEDTNREILYVCSDKFPSDKVEALRDLYLESGSVDALFAVMDKDRSWYGLSYYESPKRKGRVIHVTKIPFNPKGCEDAADELERRYHYCHCPLVKELIRHPEQKISRTFCYCSSGWYRSLWEGILGEPVRVDVVKTVLQGDDRCSFVIRLPPGTRTKTPPAKARAKGRKTQTV